MQGQDQRWNRQVTTHEQRNDNHRSEPIGHCRHLGEQEVGSRDHGRLLWLSSGSRVQIHTCGWRNSYRTILRMAGSNFDDSSCHGHRQPHCASTIVQEVDLAPQSGQLARSRLRPEAQGGRGRATQGRTGTPPEASRFLTRACLPATHFTPSHPPALRPHHISLPPPTSTSLISPQGTLEQTPSCRPSPHHSTLPRPPRNRTPARTSCPL